MGNDTVQIELVVVYLFRYAQLLMLVQQVDKYVFILVIHTVSTLVII